MVEALEITIRNNIERIAWAILRGKELYPPNIFTDHCSISNKKKYKTIKIRFNATHMNYENHTDLWLKKRWRLREDINK